MKPKNPEVMMDAPLREAVDRVRRAVGPLAMADAVSLRRALDAAGIRWTDPARHVRAALAVLHTEDDEDRVVATLLVLSPSLPPPLLSALAFATARTLYDLGAFGLFSVRAELLELVVQLRPPPDLLADTLVALANTRNAFLSSPEERRVSRALLDQAIVAAQAADRDDLRADAETLWVRTSLLGLLDDAATGDAERVEALGRLDRLLDQPLDEWRRANALWAKGLVLLHPGPRHDREDAVGAVAALEACIRLMPEDAWRADAERDLSFAMARSGRRSEALDLARRLLRGPYAGPSGRGLAHAHLARLLAEGGDPEAEAQFTEALRQLGGEPERLLVLLQLAEYLLMSGRKAEACGHLARVADERAHLRAPDQLLLDRLSAQAGLEGWDAAVHSAVGTAFEGLGRAERATREGNADGFWLVFSDFVNGRWPTNPEVDRQMAHLAAGCVEALPHLQVNQVKEWAAKAGHTWLHARLLDRSGDPAGAREVLERALPSCATAIDRVNHRMLLLSVLPREPALLRPVIEAIESEAVEVPPVMLHDLSVACRLAAADAREWQARSLKYAEAATCGLAGALRAKARRAWLAALSETVAATFPVSDPWLAQPCLAVAGSMEEEDEAVLLPVIAMLVAAGPLIHPELIPAVEALLERVTAPAAQELVERVAAVRQLQEGWEVPLPPLRGVDEPPWAEWVVRLIAGQEAGPLPGAVASNVKEVARALAVRPDRADALLAVALPEVLRLPGDLRSAWLELIEAEVRIGQQGDGAWPSLVAAVRALGEAAPRVVVRALRWARRDPTAPADALDALERASNSAERREQADAALKAARGARDPETARRHKELAVQALSELAVDEPGPDVTLSLGNAWRLPPDPDPARAIQSYQACFATGPTEPAFLGTLHKVWADALRESGGDAAIREAQQHIDIALVCRSSGWMRAEALWSAAEIAARHPDYDEETRGRRAAERYAESVRVAPAASEQVLPRLLELLARWRPAGHDAEVREAILDDLSGRYPERVPDIQRARIGGLDGPLPGMARMSDAEQAHLIELLQDPEFQGVVAARSAIDLQGPDALQPALERVRAGVGIGASVSRALLLVALARGRRASESEARAATELACAALAESTSRPGVTAFLMHQLGDAWAPRDHVADPLRDFGLSVELHRRAVSALGGLDKTPRDIVVGLARSLRYAPTTDPRSTGSEVRLLLERALAHDRAANNARALANDLTLLADLELHLGDGAVVERHRRAAAIQREAMTHAVDDDTRGLCAGNLGWTLTVLAQHEQGEAALKLLDEALRHYDDAERWLDNPSGHVANNRSVCLDLRAQLLGQPDESVRLWEARVAAEGHSPDRLAQARHNLAEALIRRESNDDGLRAIALYRQALAARPSTRVPRQHYESALALTLALLHQRPAGWHPEAVQVARSAIAAARGLGVGTELAVAATALAEVALQANTTQEVEALAEESWRVRRESAAVMLLDARSRTDEARTAVGVAFRLADLALRTGLVGQVRGAAALGAMASEAVLRWLLRADAPAHRLVAARLHVPDGAPVDRVEWERALTHGDVAAVERIVVELRAADPTWLLNDPSLADTDRWIRSGSGAVAVGVWPGRQGVLVVVLKPDGRPTVLVLDGEAPELDDQVVGLLRNRAERPRLLKSLVSWADQVLQPVREFLGARPERVLWCPHGVFSLIPPSKLFPGVAVSVTRSLALRSSKQARPRPQRNVVVVADPAGHRGLGTAALEGARQLSGVLDPCRVVVGVGPQHGPQLLATAVDLHPTVRNTIQELDSAAFAVVLAHGATDGPDQAWIELLADDGTPDRLDVAALARDPGAVAELSVVLLSCETGRAADHADLPGGVAGTLLLAGAREVVAPLWEVGLHGALKVAEVLCRARSEGVDLSVALASLGKAAVPDGGPVLGRPSPVDREAASWDAPAFVRWVG